MCSFFHVLIPKTAPHFLAEGNNEVCVFRKFSFVSIFLRTKRLHLKKKTRKYSFYKTRKKIEEYRNHSEFSCFARCLEKIRRSLSPCKPSQCITIGPYNFRFSAKPHLLSQEYPNNRSMPFRNAILGNTLVLN